VKMNEMRRREEMIVFVRREERGSHHPNLISLQHFHHCDKGFLFTAFTN